MLAFAHSLIISVQRYLIKISRNIISVGGKVENRMENFTNAV